MRGLRVKALLTAALLLCACGYRLIDGRGALGIDLQRIEIKTFDNQTSEPGIEQMLADALTEEFVRRDWLTPVYAGQDIAADLVMAGAVEAVRVSPNSYSSVALSLEDRVDLVVDVSVRKVASGELVWEHPGFKISELFRSSPEPQVYASNKEQALRRVAALLSERIHDELFQRF